MLTLLDLAPMRGAQYRLFLLSTGGTLLNGFSLVVLGVTLPLIITHLPLIITHSLSVRGWSV